MKTILFLLVILSVIPSFSQDYPYSEEDAGKFYRLSINGSLKFENNLHFSNAFVVADLNALPSYAAGIEFFFLRDSDEKKAGIGAEYQFPNTVYGTQGSYQNFPLYIFYEMALVRVKYFALPNLHLQIGYNFLNVNDGFPFKVTSSKGGLFYSIGLSSKVIKHVYARILYSSSQGTITSNNDDYLFSSNKISLTLSLQ